MVTISSQQHITEEKSPTGPDISVERVDAGACTGRKPNY